MIIVMVTFKLRGVWSIVEATKVFEETAPKYLGREGLIRKHYFLNDEGDQAGGIYLWRSKSDAEACYTAEWQAVVTEKYGSLPEIQYMICPVTVDNLAHRIQAS